MATLKISNKSISRYFGFLKNMDTQSKKRLIIQLTDSIESKKGIDHLFGAWEDSRTAEEIIAEIRTAEECAKIRSFAGPKNEENFDRLERELGNGRV